MTRKAEMYASSVVCLGAFNPAILSPDWLQRNSLIGSQDADLARQGQTLIISHQVTQFETSWFAVQVVENQFALTSKGALTEAFKDLAAGILTLLPQTPITAIGLNFMGHYKLPSISDFHALGDLLAPKTIWNELFPAKDEPPGLVNLTVNIRKLDRLANVIKSKDFKNISVQPSNQIPHGVYLAFNDHHDLAPDDESRLLPAERAASLIDSIWDATNQDATKIFDGLISKALAKIV